MNLLLHRDLTLALTIPTQKSQNYETKSYNYNFFFVVAFQKPEGKNKQTEVREANFWG